MPSSKKKVQPGGEATKATRKKAAPKDEGLKAAKKKSQPKSKGLKTAKKKPTKLYVVQRSPVHGRGIFAAEDIPKGTRIVEYKGKRISYKQACRLYPDVEGKPTHTFLFEIDEDTVIDANQQGNAARWINHSCNPNCQAVEDDDQRIYIEAIKNIKKGKELGYDYGITLEERHTPAEKKRWPCYCGSKNCRGTLLAKKS